MPSDSYQCLEATGTLLHSLRHHEMPGGSHSNISLLFNDTLSPHLVHTPCPYTLSIHLVHTPCLHTLSILRIPINIHHPSSILFPSLLKFYMTPDFIKDCLNTISRTALNTNRMLSVSVAQVICAKICLSGFRFKPANFSEMYCAAFV